MTQQTKGQTPETDARTFLSFDPYDLRDDELKVVDAEFARKLETQRDSLLAAAIAMSGALHAEESIAEKLFSAALDMAWEKMSVAIEEVRAAVKEGK